VAERGCWAGGAGRSSWLCQATHDVPPFTWKLRAGEYSLCPAHADVNPQPGLSRYTALAESGAVLVLRVSRHSRLPAWEGEETLEL